MNRAGKKFFLKQLVPALRSGTYTQGRGQLRTQDDRFCCLGVTCDLAGMSWELRNMNGSGYYYTGTDFDAAYFLPVDLCEKFDVTNDVQISADAATYIAETYGINDCHGGDCTISLSLLNDLGMSFADIADVIEVAITHDWILSREAR